MNPDFYGFTTEEVERLQDAMGRMSEATKNLGDTLSSFNQQREKSRQTAEAVHKEVGTVLFGNLTVQPSKILHGGVMFITNDRGFQHLDAKELDDLITVLMYIKQRTEEINNGN